MPRALVPYVTLPIRSGVRHGYFHAAFVLERSTTARRPARAANEARLASALGPAMRAELEAVVAKNQGHGGGILRISSHGHILFEGAAGRLGSPASAAISGRSLFEVASVTKSFTAAATLSMVEEGKLSLDTPLGQLLPPSITNGLLVVGGHDYGPELTIRQLLQHTSGLPDHWTDPPVDAKGDNAFIRAFNAHPQKLWSPEEILSYDHALTPIGRPGSTYHYSDANYVLLGLVLESLDHHPLQDIFRARIYQPLGMHDTYLSYRERSPTHLPLSHRFEGALDLHARKNQSADWASGGLVSTTRDLERFITGLAEGRLFHSPETLREMSSWIPIDHQGTSYGLGLFRVDLGSRGSLFGHDGHGNAFMYYWPDKGITFTGTLNQADNTGPGGSESWWPLVDEAVRILARPVHPSMER